ncbi:hypothetical protein MNBD_NITROSPINAE04-2420 [hydrothermal vent metagenome]|uniref:HD domain-containing protein n=1 Tax=hydrothermal vent metagenome TaxID=652676 RepID=A0A3B1CA78_9ZZZZ
MRFNSDLIDVLEIRAKERFTGARGSHGWDHVQRVYGLCQLIGKEENCDMTVLLASALLHDIGRHECDNGNGAKCHAKVGAKIAEEMLKQEGADPDFTGQVTHCVSTHRFRGDDAPRSIEAKVLFDADKLDSIGSVGIARAFLFSGEIGARLDDPDVNPDDVEPYGPDDTARYEFLTKLLRVKERMHTKTGKRIAEGRDKFMREFFKRLDDEISGLR